jgi:hypothetical protein
MAKMSSVIQRKKTFPPTCVRTSHGQNVVCDPEEEDFLCKDEPWPESRLCSRVAGPHCPLVLGRAMSGMSSVIQKRKTLSTYLWSKCRFSSTEKDHLSPPVLGRAIARMSSVIQCEKTPSTAMSALLQESPLSYLHLNKNWCDERLLDT